MKAEQIGLTVLISFFVAILAISFNTMVKFDKATWGTTVIKSSVDAVTFEEQNTKPEHALYLEPITSTRFESFVTTRQDDTYGDTNMKLSVQWWYNSDVVKRFDINEGLITYKVDSHTEDHYTVYDADRQEFITYIFDKKKRKVKMYEDNHSISVFK